MLRVVGGLFLVLFLTLGSNNAHADMFGYGETVSSDISDFKKWDSVLQRHEVQMAANSAYLVEWKKAIQQIAALPNKADQVRVVNAMINQSIEYEDDSQVWGKSDYWATPAETFSKMKGDCDDYAVAKYYTLKMLGFTENDMRVVILKDNRKNLLHAVLSVNVNGTNMILDNQNENVMADYQIAYYQPIYSINQNNWWKHS